MERPYTLSCHCGAIRCEVDADLKGLLECNCSTCRRLGYISWYVQESALRLLTEKRALTFYAWRDLHGGYSFCPTCGVAMIRHGYPDRIVAVNARCIEDLELFELETQQYDGRTQIPPGPLP